MPCFFIHFFSSSLLPLVPFLLDISLEMQSMHSFFSILYSDRLNIHPPNFDKR
ncbi:hypothetical protein AAHE18_16G165200 [Arachis hypogaea]